MKPGNKNTSESSNPEQPLLPGKADAHRVVSIDQVLALLKSAGSPRFAKECQAFVEAIEPEDVVVEFCTSRKSWRKSQGSSGFQIERQGTVVAKLVTRFN